MIEYLVESLHGNVPIEDLKKEVKAGDPIWVTEEEYEQSICLKRLAQRGMVRVSQGKRSRMSKKRPTAQAVRLSRPTTGKDVKKNPPPTPAPIQGIPLAEVERMIQKAAQEAAQKTAEAFLAAMPTAPSPQPTGDLEGRVERAVGRAIAQHGTPASGTPSMGKPRASDEPVFIPTGLIGDGSEDLKIASESSDDGGLSDAAEALKKMKRGAKKKT